MVLCLLVNRFPQQVLDLPELLDFQLFLVGPEKQISAALASDQIKVADARGESSQQDQVVHGSLSLLGFLVHPRCLAVQQHQLVLEVHQVPDRETRRRVWWQAPVEDQHKWFFSHRGTIFSRLALLSGCSCRSQRTSLPLTAYCTYFSSNTSRSLFSWLTYRPIWTNCPLRRRKDSSQRACETM